MKVAVIVPDEYMGDVIGDLNCPPWPDPGHGGHALALSVSTLSFLWLRCSATLPTCVPRLRAVASMSWSRLHYEPVPKSIADQIIAGRTKG